MNRFSDAQQIDIDVAVVGAGISGVPAAVAASRAGARTLLVEQRGGPGGVMLDGYGFPVCGLFENSESTPPQLANGGLPAEFFKTVQQMEPDSLEKTGRVWVCRCSPETLPSIYSAWLNDTDISILYGIRELHFERNGDRLEVLSCKTADGCRLRYRVKQFVDCTGTGQVLAKSGAEMIHPERLPFAGLAVQLRGVLDDDMLPVKVPYVLSKAVENGLLPVCFRFTVFCSDRTGGAYCKFSFPDGTDLHAVEETVQLALSHLRCELPAFRCAERVRCSSVLLSREGRRLKGRIVLRAEDLRLGRRFDRVVARCAWPMEYWDTERGVQYEYLSAKSAEIPEEALKSSNVTNLWAAGRLVSADSMALSSLRVMGTAMATGEAAGRGAAKELT